MLACDAVIPEIGSVGFKAQFLCALRGKERGEECGGIGPTNSNNC